MDPQLSGKRARCRRKSLQCYAFILNQNLNLFTRIFIFKEALGILILLNVL